jgi:hypothetical protein
MPREKRTITAKEYIAGVVVVHVGNHNVTRVLEEKVDDMPAMGWADGVVAPAEDVGGMSMFISKSSCRRAW